MPYFYFDLVVGEEFKDQGGMILEDTQIIPLPRGRQLVTLEDAGRYITKLPKAEHEAAEWQAAMEALIWWRHPAGRRCLRTSGSCGH